MTFERGPRVLSLRPAGGPRRAPRLDGASTPLRGGSADARRRGQERPVLRGLRRLPAALVPVGRRLPRRALPSARADRRTSTTSPGSPFGLRRAASSSRSGGWSSAAGRSRSRGVCDILDGRIARAMGVASRYGDFIDCCSTASSRWLPLPGLRLLPAPLVTRRAPGRDAAPSAARCRELRAGPGRVAGRRVHRRPHAARRAADAPLRSSAWRPRALRAALGQPHGHAADSVSRTSSGSRAC